MHKTLYIIRHCKATGQAPEAALTAAGAQQALRLADQLAPYAIEQIISSPYLRATQSIAPLAERLGLPIITDERLIERVLSAQELAEWLPALRASFDDFELALPGGESSRAATQRALAAFHSALAQPAHRSALVTHGNLMTLLLRSFDPAIGFDFWQQLANPDVYCVEWDGVAGRLA